MNDIEKAIAIVKSALEKQIPKKPLKSDYGDYQCPRCLEDSLFTMPGYQDYDYCANCGQKISWSEVENE